MWAHGWDASRALCALHPCGRHFPLPPVVQGGQAQRVQLAIAVALRPLVLLLDEPTSALDTDSALRVERLLKTCGAGEWGGLEGWGLGGAILHSACAA